MTEKNQQLDKKKTKTLEIYEILFIIFFMILVFGIVYFMFKSMDSKNLVINAKHMIKSNETDLLFAATENVINKIYNILVVSTIFFTIIVASVSIFQFIKVNESTALKKEMENELNQFKKDYAINLGKVNESLVKFDTQFAKTQENYDQRMIELANAKEKTERKSAELEIEVCFLKAKDASDKNYHDSHYIKDSCYKRILEIRSIYPDIIGDERLAIVLTNLAFIQTSYEDAKNYYMKALPIQNNTVERVNLLNNIGRMERDFGNYNRAIEYFKEAHSLIQNDLPTIINLINLLDKRNQENDIDEAYKLCEEAVRRHGIIAANEINTLVSQDNLKNIKEEYQDYFLLLLKQKISNEKETRQ